MPFIRRPLAVGCAATVLISLSGCADGQFTKSDFGALAGAALGGYLGSKVGSGEGQMLAVALGTVAGSMIGGKLGDVLDEADKARVEAATLKALNAGADGVADWESPDSGRSGTVSIAEADSEDGRSCALANQTARVDGESITQVAKFCLNGSNEWDFVELI